MPDGFGRAVLTEELHELRAAAAEAGYQTDRVDIQVALLHLFAARATQAVLQELTATVDRIAIELRRSNKGWS